MSSPDPPPQLPPTSPPTDPPLPERDPILHNSALVLAVLAPVALVLPSRGGKTKSTLQNALLGGTAFWAFNQLAHDYTGKSITARSRERWGALLGFDKKTKEGEGAQEEEKQKKKAGWFSDLPTETARRNRELMEAERRRRAEAEGREYVPKHSGEDNKVGWWKRVWMGGEKEDWKERRLEEERKALEAGKGYGDLIVEQIKEVLGKGEKKEGSKREEGEGKKE
ncbi:hypothetical protein VTJ04DRAFT_6425 [Mycothermus thermophilus]|uniref:uncharacterized protein n=1 Tax=Humicola insolens TaxID=85995 RepID=UPI003743DFEE